MTAIADLITPDERDRLLKRLAEWRGLADVMRRPGGMPAVPEPPALHQMAIAPKGRNQMTEPSGQPGADIRAGDKVRRRDTGEEGDVTDVLPFYGGFQGGPDTVLLVVAVVKWTGTRQRTVMRVDDLDKLSTTIDR